MNRAILLSDNYEEDHVDSSFLLRRKPFKRESKLFLKEGNVYIIVPPNSSLLPHPLQV